MKNENGKQKWKTKTGNGNEKWMAKTRMGKPCLLQTPLKSRKVKQTKLFSDPRTALSFRIPPGTRKNKYAFFETRKATMRDQKTEKASTWHQQTLLQQTCGRCCALIKFYTSRQCKNVTNARRDYTSRRQKSFTQVDGEQVDGESLTLTMSRMAIRKHVRTAGAFLKLIRQKGLLRMEYGQPRSTTV